MALGSMKLPIAVIVVSSVVIVKGFFADDSQHEEGLHTSGTIRGQLLAAVAAQFPTRNVVCSPLAAVIPLAKLAVGSKSSILKELLEAVGVRDLSQLWWEFNQLTLLLPKAKGVTLVTEVYVNKKYKLAPKYAAEHLAAFRSSPKIIGFKPEDEPAKKINNLVDQQTHGLYKNMFSPRDIPDRPSVLLVSAVNFKAEWLEPFPAATLGDFHSINGKQKVPMISKTSTYNYVMSNALLAQIIEIPYQGREASLVIILPKYKDGDTLQLLFNALKLNTIDKEMKKMKPRKVSLTIPKFRTETELDLTKLYKKLGVEKLFKSGIKGMVKGRRVTVAAAVQKMVLEVSDDVKNATTAVKCKNNGTHASDDIEFHADHSFLYFITVEREQLFAGVFR